MSDSFAQFVDVVLPLPVANHYTYRVPLELEAEIAAGKRVIVQFGKRRYFTAVVLKVHAQPPKGYEAKYILNILDEMPLISPEMIRFWEWMAAYYMCTLGDVMQAAIPAALKPESQTRISLHADYIPDAVELSDKEYLLVEALLQQQPLEIDQAEDILNQKNIFPVLKSLVQKEVISLSEAVDADYQPRTLTAIRLGEAYQLESTLEVLFQQLEKKVPQLNVLMAYLVLKQEQEHVSKRMLLQQSQTAESPLNSLIRKGILENYRYKSDPLSGKISELRTFELNEPQQQAYESVQEQFKLHEVVLLHGITSSGKTHVYVRLIEEQLALGKQVLLLLPEIALTSQIVWRIRKYFGEEAIAFHSRYSMHERVEMWMRVQQNKVKIIIGARSAVFLPFHSLGLVIVDEEHESSYKQQDPAPRYHARDAAIYLAYSRGCKTLLGSATPSFESYYNAQQGKYGLTKLHSRFGEIGLPKMVTADLAEEKRVRTMHGLLTSVLHDKIKLALENHQQVILFQNRRGYAPLLECQQCHHIPRCQNCDISLTYHKYNDSLKCHYCGYTLPLMKNCTACGSHLVDLKGFGTEKIEDELHVHFPEARIARLDFDTAKGKNGHHEIIRSFEAHESDILIGTQMLSKGLDFGKVTLVGVINADQLLFFPDFRAFERAFQLLTQVSGRAGRGSIQGEVVIQSAVPQHHVIQEVIAHRYDVLYVNTIEERKQFGYPPFTRLIKLTIKHKDLKTANHAAFELFQRLQKRLGDNLIGPESPFVSRIRTYYVKEILVKLDRESKFLHASKQFIHEHMKQVLTMPDYKRCLIYADVDPM
ncbi:MAG: primosomal protein N' [Bacteroidia bacterium]